MQVIITSNAPKRVGKKTYKGYIAVYVCIATEAIHLEMVSDLTSGVFLAELRRFIASG